MLHTRVRLRCAECLRHRMVRQAKPLDALRYPVSHPIPGGQDAHDAVPRGGHTGGAGRVWQSLVGGAFGDLSAPFPKCALNPSKEPSGGWQPPPPPIAGVGVSAWMPLANAEGRCPLPSSVWTRHRAVDCCLKLAAPLGLLPPTLVLSLNPFPPLAAVPSGRCPGSPGLAYPYCDRWGAPLGKRRSPVPRDAALCRCPGGKPTRSLGGLDNLEKCTGSQCLILNA